MVLPLDLASFFVGAVATLAGALVAIAPRWANFGVRSGLAAPVPRRATDADAGAAPVGPARVLAAPDVGQDATQRAALRVPATDRAKQQAPLSEAVLRPAEDHATSLLEWLRGPGGIEGGELTFGELELCYRDMCAELGFAVRPWPSVAKALRAALGDGSGPAPKSYGYRSGKRVRVYRVTSTPAGAPTPYQRDVVAPTPLARAA